MRGVIALIMAACAGLLGGCATTSPEAIAANDPFEPANRAVYRFDEKFDKYVELPIAGFYVYYVPAPIHHAFHNFLVNLDMPVTFANDVLQGEFSRAGTSLGRITLNSTLGLGGLIDVATPAGLPYHRTEFGQTLGIYGVPEGPFLVLPLIGPDPPRDLVGDAADIMIDPLFYLPPGAPFYERFLITATLRTASPFEKHARNIVLREELERGSVDPYVTMRSVYRQLRAEEIGARLPDMGGPAGK
ncbi:MAG: VacJ family lipoprotein [Rhizomicrobium sp.]